MMMIDNFIQRQAVLHGCQPNAPLPCRRAGNGTAVLTINDDRTQIGYTLTYTGLTNVMQAHIHVGNADSLGLSSSSCARM